MAVWQWEDYTDEEFADYVDKCASLSGEPSGSLMREAALRIRHLVVRLGDSYKEEA